MINDNEFIRLWENSKSRQEVADACHISGAAAGMRANKLRKLGHSLKTFKRGRPKLTSRKNT